MPVLPFQCRVYIIPSAMSSDSSSSGEDSSDEDVCGCGSCYPGSSLTCRACGCSGCETDTVCLYPDSDDEDDGPHDIRYWEQKARDTQNVANYLTVDLRKQVNKTVKVQQICDHRVAFAENERIRMKKRGKEKLLLIEAENKHQLEMFKDSHAHLMDVIKARHDDIAELQEEVHVKQEEIDKIKIQLADAVDMLKSTKKSTRKRSRN
jgi:hypothetical protein